jgi:hypothetical protein
MAGQRHSFRVLTLKKCLGTNLIVFDGHYRLPAQPRRILDRVQLWLAGTVEDRVEPIIALEAFVPRKGSVVHREIVEKLPSGFGGMG